MLREFRVDLHVHTCLSPCGEWEMSPQNIARRCRETELAMIAVCDHNSCENAAAVMAAGRRHGLAVLPGMEVCTREEVHVLALFGELARAQAMQQIVYERLGGRNVPEIFGFQIVATARDEVLDQCPRLLIGAADIGLEETVAHIHALKGLSLAAHIDRPVGGIVGQLGFIPPGLGLDGVEVSPRTPAERVPERFPAARGLPCLSFSDAHRLEEIGRAFTRLRLGRPTFYELTLALRGKAGRRVLPGA